MKIKGISLFGGNQFFTSHFVNESTLILELTQQSMEGITLCWDRFVEVNGIAVSEEIIYLFF